MITSSREAKKKITTRRRQQQILDAALVQFSKKGFDQATTAEIAQTAGIAEGTIYNYYPSKYDLLVALVSRYLDVEHILGLLETALDSSDTDIIHSIIKERLDVVFNNFESLMFLMPEIQRNPELRTLYAEQVLQPKLVALSRYFDSGISSGIFRRFDSDVVGRVLLATVIGLSTLYRLEGKTNLMSNIPYQDIIDETANLFLKGIQKC